MSIVYLNGRYVPVDQAFVPVEDRGLQLGDGIYEVLRIYDGHIFALQRHLNRLEKSAAAIDLAYPGEEAMARVCTELVRRNGASNGLIYIQLTRGTAPRQHAFPEQVSTTVIAYIQPPHPPEERLYREGAVAIVVPDERWLRCDIKSTNLLPNVLAKEKARRAGAYEAILEREGYGITEGASSNVFVVRDGRLHTPPANRWILSGVTREVVIELAAAEGIPVREEPLSRSELMGADEVFVTGTNTEIMPVTRIDGRIIGSGKVGAVTTRLMEAFARAIRQSCQAAG